MPSPEGWAKNAVGKTSLGANTKMPKETKKKSSKKNGDKDCDCLTCFYGNQEPGMPVCKIYETLPQPNHFAGLKLPYCPRCGEKV